MALGIDDGAVPERKGKSANADHTELGAVGTPVSVHTSGVRVPRLPKVLR